MKTDGDLLLESVLADPECDTPRLIYADWLDEQCDPKRAELAVELRSRYGQITVAQAKSLKFSLEEMLAFRKTVADGKPIRVLSCLIYSNPATACPIDDIRSGQIRGTVESLEDFSVKSRVMVRSLSDLMNTAQIRASFRSNYGTTIFGPMTDKNPLTGLDWSEPAISRLCELFAGMGLGKPEEHPDIPPDFIVLISA